MENIQRKGFDYKWVVIAASFVMVFTTLGFCSSTKKLFLGPATEALGVLRSVYSINDSFRYITTSVANLFFGVLVAKFGPRKLIGFGFLSLIGSMLLYSCATDIGMIYAGGSLLGLGLTMTTTTMVGYVVNIWYKEKRGTIMGAILCANGIGGALATQILDPIILQDFRLAYRIVAVILLVIGILVVAVFRNAPKDRTLPQQNTGNKKQKGDTWSGITLKEALRKPYFYTAAICIFLTGLCLQSAEGVSKQHMMDRGISGDLSRNIASISSLALAACKFLVGVCNDRKGLKFTMLICDISAIAMMPILAFSADNALGEALACIYPCFYAVAMPLETIMLPLIVADLFGEKQYGKMLGIFVSVNTAGYACGPFIINVVYDMIGTYTPILLVYACVMVAITVAFCISQKQADKIKKGI